MANIRNGNTFYIDAASDGGTPASFIDEKQSKVAYITFSSSAAGDEIILADLDASTGTAAGALKVVVKEDDANGTNHCTYDGAHMVFPNGIWVVSISSGAKATLVLSSRGG